MASSVASKAARDALFLDRYRAIDLPYVDIAIAVLVGFAASLYIWVGHRTNLRNLQVGSLRVLRAERAVLLVVGAAGLVRIRRAVHRHLRLGRRVLGARAVTGVDAGELRADDARGEAIVWLHRQRRDPRVDRRRLRDARRRLALRHREHARLCRARAVHLRRHRHADLARSAELRRQRHARLRRRARSVPAVGQPEVDSRVALPEVDRGADHHQRR